MVRKHFDMFSDSIILEEQSSDNPKIKKLLSTASKSGLGMGFPEFIIQYKNNPDFLIVIECKADITKHESQNKDKYKDFSVDGVLLYSSYLSKDFDVLSIAVSGETNNNKKISHFLQVKGDKNATEIFGDKFLSTDDYLNGYIKSPEKFRQDYEKLLTFSKDLNEKLHGHKIVESDRGLLISCILISLENKAFHKSYKDYSDPKQLAEYLVTTVKNEFQNGNIGEDKLSILTSRFEFIKTDTSLSKNDNVLRDIISDINENIKDFIKTHEYFDVLGQLYIEFLRYANSDKGLGIVLTPPHITAFMAELAEVNKDSTVYDNCTGTGGFLVSAMNLMIKDAKGDQNKINNIKKNQLIGIEYQAHIFALACSNMFIHQDGKSNILNGSCFDEAIINGVNEYNPTVGLLNPPYKSKKGDDEEFDFILNNLARLEQGGKCVAIIPLSLGQEKKGKILELKKRLLALHTLEAVFSMPDELFFNSKVATVTCVMVFTAKRPHPKNKKTFFGYYKNDGFVKRKNKGRIDLYQNFEQEIKEKWITAYMNREEKAGFSVTKQIKPEDEWCAETYMETDYTGFNDALCIQKMLEYSTFLFSNKIRNTVSNQKILDENLKLDVSNWEYFNLVDLFDICSTRDPLITDLSLGGNVPYITSSETNNGVTNFVHEDSNFGANTITANRGGSVGYFFYQPINYLATPVDVRVLKPKFNLNPFNGTFLATILQMEKYRYNYSRKMGTDRLKEFKIKLPKKGENPDWDLIERYIKTLPYSSNL
jgi:hypothetical protein